MPKLPDIVPSRNDGPETGITAGTEGTISDAPGNGEAFSAEFSDADGNTIEAPLYQDYTPEQLRKGKTALA